MKLIHPTLLFSLALLLSAMPLIAQQEDQQEQEDQNKVIIITKTIDEDGNEVVKKIEKHVDVIEHGDSDIQIIHDGDGTKNINIDIDENDGQKRIRIKGIDADGEEFDIEWEGEGEIPAEIQEKMEGLHGGNGERRRHRIMEFKGHHGDHGFLGVHLGKKVENIDGEETTTGESELGVEVMDVVEGSGAAEAGLQAGDIITGINGKSVKTISDLTSEIREHKAGDQIEVSYLREGKAATTQATLQEQRRKMGKAFHWNSDDHEDFHFDFKDGDFEFDFDDDFDFAFDYCKPFIGVYLDMGSDNEEGISVRRIVPETPADEVNLQSGDLIIALDNVPVSTHGELVTERDKHEPGDRFTLTIVRNGETQTVEATFPACDENRVLPERKHKMIIIKKKKEETPDSEAEQSEENLNVSPERASLEVPESTLQLSNFRAFPNPTDDQVTVRFEAENAPMILTVNDITGKEIFREEINNFDGFYNRQLNLGSAAPGTLLLSIRQGERVFTDKIILRKED